MECLKILNPIDKKLEKNIYLFIKFPEFKYEVQL